MTQQQLSYLTQGFLIALLKSSWLVIRRSSAGVCENHPSDDLVAWKSQSWAFEVFIFMSSLEDVTSRSCQKEVVFFFFVVVALIEQPRQKQLEEERFIWLTVSEGYSAITAIMDTTAIIGGETGQAGQAGRSTMRPHYISSQETEKIGSEAIKSQSPPPHNILPPTRFELLKVPQSFKQHYRLGTKC